MRQVVAVDIGGTHARFAIASYGHGEIELGEVITLRTSGHESLETAWTAFADRIDRPLPPAAAIAIAAPIDRKVVTLTNNSWTIDPASIEAALSIEHHLLINDFVAVGHAIAQASNADFLHLCGPDALFEQGTISIVGPGTGLGVAHLYRDAAGYRVRATEGGHLDFAPLDPFEDDLLARLRNRWGRVSVERLLSGQGLMTIYEQFAGGVNMECSAETLWRMALEDEDERATAALERFCQILGSVAGDIALAQGGFAGVVIAGGLGLRLRDVLPRSGFPKRFRAKGRFEALMGSIPVKLLVHPQPGLFGAAAAFAKKYP